MARNLCCKSCGQRKIRLGSATSGEVKDLRREVRDMNELVADLALENRLLKKSMVWAGEDQE